MKTTGFKTNRRNVVDQQRLLGSVGSRAAFTLTELVAILAVLALLLSVMTPAIGRVKPGYQAFHCMNNLRRIMNAITFYAYDNHDLMPPNPDNGITTPGYNWCSGNVQFNAGPDEFDPDLMRDPTRTLVAPYLNFDAEVFRCTADARTGLYDGEALYPQSVLKGKQVPAARSISMSQAVGTIDPGFENGGGDSGPPCAPTNGPWLTGSHGANSAQFGPWRTYGKLSQMVDPVPSQLWVVIEEAPLSINDGGLAMSVGTVRWIDYPSTLHNFGCALAFADGHSELHKWSDPSTDIFYQVSQIPPAASDWNWLAARTSAKVSR
jgi:prepilin-type processing-associated H-X9-DG protein